LKDNLPMQLGLTLRAGAALLAAVHPVQERVLGGLDRESLKVLGRFGASRRLPWRELKPGTVLVRDYHNRS
jgi:hypothetical protein